MQNLKVLVVDDSAPLHQIYTIILTRYRFDVIRALSGQEGLDRLAENPDLGLVIVDLVMPRMSGLEFIRQMRAREAFRTVPIIVVTSSGAEADAAEAQAFTQGHVKKPFTSNELHAMIGKAVLSRVA